MKALDGGSGIRIRVDLGNREVIKSLGVGLGAQAVRFAQEIVFLQHRLDRFPHEIEKPWNRRIGPQYLGSKGDPERLFGFGEYTVRRALCLVLGDKMHTRSAHVYLDVSATAHRCTPKVETFE